MAKNYIALTLRYPKDAGNLIYICPDDILAFSVNMTDKGILGSVIYTANSIPFHIKEDTETVYNLIKKS